jgi:EmrB/QacA subfamily drug resistance transporter
MSSVDGTIVATGLPTLRHALHARLNWAGWTITGYQLGLVVSMPLMGRFGDQIGRRKVFLWAAVVFTTASFLCGLATDIYVLVALRVVQALGAGAFLPSASGLIADAFGNDRDRAIGLMSGVFPTGALVGPIFGGIIIANWSWRVIFFVNVPIGLAFTLLALRFLPRSRPQGGRADLRGALMLGSAVLLLMLAVTRLGYRHTSLDNPGFLGPLAASLLIGYLFVRRASRVAEPLIPARLLKGRSFILMNIINVTWGACVLGQSSLVPLLAEERYGFRPLEAGTLLTTRAIAEMGVAVLAATFIARTGYRIPMVAGFLLIATGLAVIAIHAPIASPYSWLVIGTGLSGVGIGASAPAANTATMHLAPGDVGAISGLRGASRQIGGILGIALTTSYAARSAGETVGLSRSFLAMAALLVVMTTLVRLAVPRGSGVAGRQSPLID